MTDVQPIALHEAARERYLSYALSVITARALPDVRDGLKPVHRRILYTMYRDLNLKPDGRYRKSAAVVGEVMGKYHPHGDQSIYDALVRMAQDFSLRDPLVDGQGNFGSLDGDPPAAMRYTECKLRELAMRLLDELGKDTVDTRDTYDGQRQEPIVLPAQFPQLLVNGAEGIAVGMSTRIPPHNLAEVIEGCIALIDGTAHTVSDLLEHIKGPDFPTGGLLLNDRESLEEIYTDGKGSLRIRGQWTTEKEGRRVKVVITSIPYALNKQKLVERIGGDVRDRKLPQVVDVRDESTDEVRIVLDLKKGASPETVMAYLYKRTNLETTFPVNFNALVPGTNPETATPQTLDLVSALRYWLDFRYETIRRRLEHDLKNLRERIHILEGLATIVDVLDEVIQIIRNSENKKDAAKNLLARFEPELDEVQIEAILELKLYRLANYEIRIVLEELEAKRAEAAEISRTLASEVLMWGQVRAELVELRDHHGSPRRTQIGEPAVELEFDEAAYIVKEETFLVVTWDGWVKRQSSFSDVSKIRIRDGDGIGWLLRTDTQTTATFFFSDGAACTLRVGDVQATTGYGSPLQVHFAVSDGAKVVGTIVHDPDHWSHHPEGEVDEGDEPPPHVVSVTKNGRIQRMPLEAFSEPSNRNGRRFARLGKGDEVLAAYPSCGGERVCVATDGGNVLCFPVSEANVLKAAGKGTTAIKLKKGERVIAYELALSGTSGPKVYTNNGREVNVTERFCGGTRAARGRSVIRRGGLEGWERPQILWLGEAEDVDAAPDDDEDGGEA